MTTIKAHFEAEGQNKMSVTVQPSSCLSFPRGAWEREHVTGTSIIAKPLYLSETESLFWRRKREKNRSISLFILIS